MARRLEVEIVGDASSLQRAFGNAGKSSSSLGRSLSNLGRVAAVGVGAAFVGMGLAVRRGFKELSEGQQVAAQTRAGLRSTGAVANVTAKEIDNLAQSVSRKTGIDDEAVQAGENMLLTFTKVRNEVGKGNDIFNQATVAVTDMATRMNDGAIPSMEQISQSSLRLGKALNDPLKGMGALSRVGVQFDADQKKLITTMVKSGDIMGAQKLILAELTKEFGGSAKAAGDTLPGQLAKVNNAFDTVTEKIAVKLLPHLTDFLNWVLDHMPQIEAVIGRVVKAISTAFEGIGKAFDIAKGPLGAFREYLENNPEKAKILAGAILGIATALGIATLAQLAFNLAALANPWVAAIAAVGALAGALIALYITSDRARAVMDDAFKRIREVVQTTVAVLTAIWSRFGDTFIAVGKAILLTVTLGFRNMFDILRGIINIFAGLFTGDWRRMWTGVKQVFDGAIGNLIGVVRAMAGALLTAARQAGTAIVQGVVAGLARLGPAVVEKLLAIRAALISAAGQAAGWAVGIGQAIVSGILSGVGGLFGRLKSALEGQLRSALSSLNPFSSVEHGGEVHIGKPLVDGAVAGVEKNASKLRDALVSKVQDAVDKAKTAVDNARSAFGQAFGELMSNALSAFDAKAGLIETRAEKMLRLMDEAAKKADIKGAIAEARAGLREAQAAVSGITPGEGESDADFQSRLAAATAKSVEAQRTLEEALAAQRRFQLEQQALKERKALDDRLALRRRHFEEDLLGLQNYANRHALTAEQLNVRLIEIFKRYRVPFKKGAIELGSALAEGLREAAVEVGNAAQAVRDMIMKYLSHIQIRVNLDVTAPDTSDDRPRRRQHGGPVRKGSAYIVGEAGPELFIPSASGRIMANGSHPVPVGGAGTTVQLVFNGPTVGTSREFEDTVRRALYDVSRRNPRLAI